MIPRAKVTATTKIDKLNVLYENLKFFASKETINRINVYPHSIR
jgi:hypothetical protein